MTQYTDHNDIHELMKLLVHNEAQLVTLMDQRDEVFFMLPGWLRATNCQASSGENEAMLTANKNWLQYQDIGNQINAVRKTIKAVEREIASMPVTTFDQLIAKACFAKSVFYNTHIENFEEEVEPESLEELFAYHLEQDIRYLAEIYERPQGTKCGTIANHCQRRD